MNEQLINKKIKQYFVTNTICINKIIHKEYQACYKTVV